MPIKCYTSDSQTLSFGGNKTLNKILNVQFFRFPPVIVYDSITEDDQFVKRYQNKRVRTKKRGI
jgi:hypothetical protein